MSSSQRPHTTADRRPNLAISEIENGLLTSSSTQHEPKPITPGSSTMFPLRRAYYSDKSNALMQTNHFEIIPTDKKVTYYRYVLTANFVTPLQQPQGQNNSQQPQSLTSRPKLRQLVDHIITQPAFAGIEWATDYATIIVTTTALSDEIEGWKQYTLPPPGRTANSPATLAQGVQNMSITPAVSRHTVRYQLRPSSTFALSDMTGYLKSPSTDAIYDGRVEMVQLLNMIICKVPNQANERVAKGANQKFFPLNGKTNDLGDGLEAVQGYYASVRPATGRLLLNLNITTGVFFKAGPLTQMVTRGGDRRQEEIRMKGLKVEIDYSSSNNIPGMTNKTRTVVSFSHEPTNSPTQHCQNAHDIQFELRAPGQNPRKISVFNYFKDCRGITLQFPQQPVINCGTVENPQYIPLELCRILPGQQYRKILSGAATESIRQVAGLKPADTAANITGPGLALFGLAGTTARPSPTLPFGFRVQPTMIVVPSQVLNQPAVHYRQNKRPRVNNGSWRFEGHQLAESGRCGDWQILVINSKQSTAFDTLENDITQNLISNNVTMGKRRRTEYLDLPTSQNTTQALIDTFKKAKSSGIRVLLTVIPSKDKWLYSRIKYVGDITVGIHTVNMVIGKWLRKPKVPGQVLSNMALKFNMKGGGISHKVPALLSDDLVDARTMVVGIDVTHPAPGNASTAPSVSAVVASVDADFFQYPGSLKVQRRREEMVVLLKEMMKERLQVWKSHNGGSLPRQVVVYRDGVSEGQYELVHTQEITQIKQAFLETYPATESKPKLAVVIVGKRHHTRFFAPNQTDNPTSGTLVDRHITGKYLYEFYLQAHGSRVGTARPAHYVLIHDEIGCGSVKLVNFTFKLSFLFNRAALAVSRCPPADYADRLCTRARMYLYDQLSINSASTRAPTNAAQAGALDSFPTITPHADISGVTWYM